MVRTEDLRRRILQSKGKVDFSLERCLNKMWYNLLTVDGNDPEWKNNMSNECVNTILNYKLLWQ